MEADSYRGNRLCLIGPLASGKTSLRFRFNGKEFIENKSRATVACQATHTFFPTHNDPENRHLKIFVDDTSGEERFRNCVTNIFIRYAQCVLLCFDLSDPDSYLEAQVSWLPWVTHKCGSEAKVIVVGLKSDLERQVPLKDVLAWTKEKGLEYFETSSKLGSGIADLEKHIGSFFVQHRLTVFSLNISEVGSSFVHSATHSLAASCESTPPQPKWKRRLKCDC